MEVRPQSDAGTRTTYATYLVTDAFFLLPRLMAPRVATAP